jgi:hypothetical protein
MNLNFGYHLGGDDGLGEHISEVSGDSVGIHSLYVTSSGIRQGTERFNVALISFDGDYVYCYSL